MTKSERAREDSFWLDGDTSRVGEEPDAVPHYDLEERTARFGEAIIDFAKRIPRGPLTDRIIDQLIGAGTSVGANYIEADDSVSKKEFLKCIGTCKKEARETKHFLRMVARAVPELQTGERKLIRHSSFTGLAETLRPARGVELVETASPSKARR